MKDFACEKCQSRSLFDIIPHFQLLWTCLEFPAHGAPFYPTPSFQLFSERQKPQWQLLMNRWAVQSTEKQHCSFQLSSIAWSMVQMAAGGLLKTASVSVQTWVWWLPATAAVWMLVFLLTAFLFISRSFRKKRLAGFCWNEKASRLSSSFCSEQWGLCVCLSSLKSGGLVRLCGWMSETRSFSAFLCMR